MAQMDESQPSGGARNYNVGVLGATGAVGQRFVELLAVHPWFQLTCLGASSKSTGVAYDAAVRWRLPSPIPNDAAKLPVLECLVENFSGKCDIIFSALDAAVAGPIESSFARSGFAVFSNAKSHRYYPQVPILIPTVNPEHLSAIEGQASFMDSRGFIVTNANCSATGLCIALAPIHQALGIASLSVATLQAVSGAGYPGLPCMDMLDNVVPFISGEEEKLEYEPNKILGRLVTGEDGCVSIQDAAIEISAMCHRVPVTEGHTVSVSMGFVGAKSSRPDANEMVAAVGNCLRSFTPSKEVAALPSCPTPVLHLLNAPDRPQPRLDRNRGDGMATCVGRVRPCKLLEVKMATLSHNTIAGAAGCSIFNAELAVVRGYVRPAGA
eukprot:GHVT01091157.1.p1 GENE.GHVT01091157.1~~GHVT01091157.1.p1  ORF type:complete len:382 (-),score=74.47 GHVT01091157.1:298-1443(-)